MAGTKSITFIFVTPIIFKPSANISILPTQVISATTASVSTGASSPASSVMAPWYTNTLTADRPTPIPRLAVRTMAEMPSRSDFV